MTRSDLQVRSQPSSFQRGEQYYAQGKVLSVQGDGKVFRAKVAGQFVYEQAVDLEKESGHCTCPYGKGGWCKHLVAVGLAIVAGEFQPFGDEISVPNVDQMRDQYRAEKLPEYAQHLSDCLKQNQWKAALDVWLGVYEGWYAGELAARRSIAPALPPDLAKLSQQLVEGLLSGSLTYADWKGLQDRWFSRWDHYEQANPQLQSKPSLRYEQCFFEPLFAAFQHDPISAHYLEMRRLAYGL
jgi:hypothetical protein